MSAYYIVILIIGSNTLHSKLSQLVHTIKTGNREKISVDLLALFLVVALIAGLIALKEFKP